MLRDETLCQMAASLLTSGRASMRVALEWLKQGLPFCPEFAITHITECSSRSAGTVNALAAQLCSALHMIHT
jgi:hypothetical protein